MYLKLYCQKMLKTVIQKVMKILHTDLTKCLMWQLFLNRCGTVSGEATGNGTTSWNQLKGHSYPAQLDVVNS